MKPLFSAKGHSKALTLVEAAQELLDLALELVAGLNVLDELLQVSATVAYIVHC